MRSNPVIFWSGILLIFSSSIKCKYYILDDDLEEMLNIKYYPNELYIILIKSIIINVWCVNVFDTFLRASQNRTLIK
jgi:hypothetical protein